MEKKKGKSKLHVKDAETHKQGVIPTDYYGSLKKVISIS